MKLRSTIREEEFATRTPVNNIDRDIKHALLVEKSQKVGPTVARFHGHKVNFSDVTYMQAIQESIMAEDVAEKALRQQNLTNKMMQRARSKEAELYARMNLLYINEDRKPKRSCCKSLLAAAKRSGESTPLTLEDDPNQWDFKSSLQDIERKLNTHQHVPPFDF
jgi:hypothetical protein